MTDSNIRNMVLHKAFLAADADEVVEHSPPIALRAYGIWQVGKIVD